jgi:hypothetical protein
MLRPDVFGGLASHAGDTLFELSAGHEWGRIARLLRDRYGGSHERFWEAFRSRPDPLADDELVLVEVWAMAACYSADADGTVRLPFDVATGRMVGDVWARWLEHDPVRMARRHADALRSLKAIYLDAGTRDEWFLDLGAEAFRRELEAIGHGCPLRAVRRGSLRDRASLPAGAPLPRRAPLAVGAPHRALS